MNDYEEEKDTTYFETIKQRFSKLRVVGRFILSPEKIKIVNFYSFTRLFEKYI